MRTHDKSLTEVRGWKDKIYEETNELSIDEFVHKIKEQADSILPINRIELASTSLSEKRQKVA